MKYQCLPIAGMNPADITGTELFGWRIHPVFHTRKHHDGVDLNDEVVLGTPIYAVADGIVEVSKMQSGGKGYGNYVVVDHGGGNFTVNAHMSERKVKTGQKVKAGDVIGYAGTTGDSTGVHVHHGFCINWNGSDKGWKDPMPMLKEAYIMQNKEHWGMKYLNNLVKKGIIKNPEDQEKTLDAPITHAEVFALVDRATDK